MTAGHRNYNANTTLFYRISSPEDIKYLDLSPHVTISEPLGSEFFLLLFHPICQTHFRRLAIALLNETEFCTYLKSIVQHSQNVLQRLILGYLVNQVAEDGSKLANNKSMKTMHDPCGL